MFREGGEYAARGGKQRGMAMTSGDEELFNRGNRPADASVRNVIAGATCDAILLWIRREQTADRARG